MKMKKTTFITQGAVIAAIYVVLVFVFDYWSFGPIQFRVAEALTILPVFTPAAVPGLFIGCLIANITGGAVIWDIVFGSLATLIGAVGTYMLTVGLGEVIVCGVLGSLLRVALKKYRSTLFHE